MIDSLHLERMDGIKNMVEKLTLGKRVEIY